MPPVKMLPNVSQIPSDMPNIWVEDKHQPGDPSAAMWTDIRQYVADPAVISNPERLFGGNLTSRRSGRIDSTSDLRDRLTNANNHFRKKAADVLGDDDAVLLLSRLYHESSIKHSDFDACQHGISLAKLSAANFCEIGANFIYITEAGQGFIESIDQ